MLTSMLASLLLLLVVMGLGIVALVFGILLTLSYVGGWGALARTHAITPQTDKGALLEEKRQRRAWVGLIRFGSLVTARAFEQGIELTANFPFSPPLFFPWADIRDYKRVSLIPFPQMDQFFVGDRRIRLSNPLTELEQRMS